MYFIYKNQPLYTIPEDVLERKGWKHQVDVDDFYHENAPNIDIGAEFVNGSPINGSELCRAINSCGDGNVYINALREYIENGKIKPNVRYFVKLYVCVDDPAQSKLILKRDNFKFPKKIIVGESTISAFKTCGAIDSQPMEAAVLKDLLWRVIDSSINSEEYKAAEKLIHKYLSDESEHKVCKDDLCRIVVRKVSDDPQLFSLAIVKCKS